jgi:hypothetical protein
VAKASLADLLVPGVCGHINRVKPNDAEAERLFRSSCHAAARDVAGRVSGVAPAEVGRNYHIATIEAPGREPEAILLHAVLPLVAAAKLRAGEMTFASVRRLERFFTQPLLLVEPELLEMRWAESQLPTEALREQEWYDIKYWKPPRVGDVVFNRFD